MLPTKETLTVEFKSDINKYPDSDIFEAIVAFANTEGGDLYLGIEDDGEITGVHADHKNPISLAAYIANNTIPPISTRSEIIEDKLPVLKITVSKSYNGIVATSSGKVLRRRIKSDGSPENVPMYPSEFATRLSDLRMLDYSSMAVIESTLEDFDPIETQRLKQLISVYNGEKALLDLDDEELYKALGMVREQSDRYIPTITGLLLVGKQAALKKYIPTHSSVFQVLEGTDVKVNEPMSLSLLSTIEKINLYFEAWNPEQEFESGLFRIPIPAFDKRAFREAVINAYSHRDYTKMGRVRICIDDNGLTIANPGGFIEGVSVKNLLTAEPHGRNPHLADALKRIGLAERTGRGIDRIYEGSLIYGKPLPDYSNSTNVTVSLHIPRSNPDIQFIKIINNEHSRLGHPLSLNDLLVLNKLKDLPRSTISQLSEAVNLQEYKTKMILDKYVEYGVVDFYGNGRGRTYIICNNAYLTKSEKIGYVRQVDINEERYTELIINLAKKNQYIARADVMQLLHVDFNKAYKLLKELTNAGILIPINKGRYAKYAYNKDK